ncbi:MAG: LPS assembly protein LptD [Proteobacteria bacterium]|nr:LPS assembly protein LptD [Pseudomonadota bacterium]MBU2226125.1 LPS assembly protein LptD [Pseudomonadota bacterium]MBU2262033.1 LPS assembly protein LptD [Pseudomonadota bacterium]
MQRLRRAFPLAILLLTCTAVSPLWALQTDFRGGPVTIEADSIAYEGDTDIFRARGKVLIVFTGGVLKADVVTLNRSTNEALAEGDVLLRSDQDVLEGERAFFDIAAKTGWVEAGKMFIARNHFYIRGERIEKKGEATYRIENATVTSCDGDKPDWRLAGRELELTVDGYGTLKDGRFLVRDLPLLYLPYFIFPAKTTRQTGLLFPRFSYSRDKNGLDVELPFYWAISGSADATFYQRYLEKRGFKEGVELRYFPSEESFGVFYGDFINDRLRITETAGVMSRDWQEDRNRWSYYLNQETVLAPGFSIRSDIRRVSDRWYFRDFSSFNYYMDHYSQNPDERFRRVSFLGDGSLGSLDSTVRMVKDWPFYNFTALARYTDDFSSAGNKATLQKYPEAILTGFRRPLFDTPLQMEFTAGYDHYYRQEGQRGHLWELNPTLYLPPLDLGPYARVAPWAGFRGSAWERTDSGTDAGDKHGYRQVFPFGASLSTEIARVFVVGSPEKVGVEKIRHAIRPEIFYNYNYVPDNASQERGPDFLARYGFQNSLTYALTNTIVFRKRGADGKISYQQMMRLMLAQTYDIRESSREVTGVGSDIRRPLSDVTVELDLTPIPNFSLAARNLYSVNYSAWQASNYDLTVYDNRGDHLSLGYRNTQSLGYNYKQTVLEELNLYLKASVTSSLDAIYILRKNLLDRKTIESTYGIKYRKQCWNVELNMTEREDDRTMMVVFSLYGLGKVGVW